MNLEKEVLQLEAKLTNPPGTMINRGLLATSLRKKMGLPHKKGSSNSCTLVWCITLGGLGLPKRFFYGDTIRAAIQQAKRSIRKTKP